MDKNLWFAATATTAAKAATAAATAPRATAATTAAEVTAATTFYGKYNCFFFVSKEITNLLECCLPFHVHELLFSSFTAFSQVHVFKVNLFLCRIWHEQLHVLDNNNRYRIIISTDKWLLSILVKLIFLALLLKEGFRWSRQTFPPCELIVLIPRDQLVHNWACHCRWQSLKTWMAQSGKQSSWGKTGSNNQGVFVKYAVIIFHYMT